ncbi:MAG: phage head morphogenesis protein [Methylobacterium sp.]|nr:phage head morphogenesis protein [Methylobacterium sp.]
MAAIADITDRAQVGVIAAMVERDDVEGALHAVGIDPVAFRVLDAATAQAFEAGGNHVVARMPVLRRPDGQRLSIRFDVRNPDAENWLREHSSRKVTEIVEDQRQMIRSALVAGMAAGRNPRDVALDLVGRIDPATGKRQGGTIGLTSNQEEWVRRYADELARLDPNALTRQLRDKRFDGTVRKAIEAGRPLTAEQIAKMVAAYRNRALRHRTETIGRTEAMVSLHQSQEEATRQAIAAGQINPAMVVEIWRTTLDGRERDTHRQMNGQTVRRGQPFVSPSGARLRYPGDPRAPASEIINCRCWREVRVDYLAEIV